MLFRSEGEGAKLDEGKTKSGKTLVKKDGVCQPSPETPSMRDLNDAVVVEEDVSGLVCYVLCCLLDHAGLID